MLLLFMAATMARGSLAKSVSSMALMNNVIAGGHLPSILDAFRVPHFSLLGNLMEHVHNEMSDDEAETSHQRETSNHTTCEHSTLL